MKYETLKEIEDEKFRWLIGVRSSPFEKMLDILSEAEQAKKAKGGRRNKLLLEDGLLMALEYIGEYRPYFHVSQSYGMSARVQPMRRLSG